MGMLKRVEYGNYSNDDAVKRVLYYIVFGKNTLEEQDICLMYAGIGVANEMGIECMVSEMETVQRIYGINYRKGRRMLHEIFFLNSQDVKELGGIGGVKVLAYALADCYFREGFQVVYGVHNSNVEGIHIHFGVNPVNFDDGRKWIRRKDDIFNRQNQFDQILKVYKDGRPRIA